MSYPQSVVPESFVPESVAPAGRGYVVAAAFAVRVASVPASDLEALRCHRTWAQVDELAAGAAWLEREGAALSDALYEVIAALSGAGALERVGEVGGGAAAEAPDFAAAEAGARKAALVGLRRAVYTGRRPDRRSLAAAQTLPAGLAARIDSWCDRRAGQAAGRAALPGMLAADTERAVGALPEIAHGEAFRHGLAQASPTLSARVDAWLAGRTRRRPPRGELLGLARYLARAAVKTSPYSSLTLSGFGEWAEHGPAIQPGEDLSWREVAELERAVLAPIWSALRKVPEVYERAGLRVNPTCTDDGDRIWFLGTGPAEPLSSVPATPAVRQLLAWVSAHPTTAGAFPAARSLVEAGLLEPLLPVDEWGGDPVRALAGWLAGVPGTAASRAGQALQSIAATAATCATRPAPAAGRPRSAVVRDALSELLSSDAKPLPWLADKNLVAASVVLTGVAGRCAAPAWQAACDDLDTIRRSLGLFDQDLAVKLAATAFFLDRYGPDATVPVLDLYRDAHTGAAENPLRALIARPLAPATAVIDPASVPGLAELIAARQGFWQALGGGPSTHPSAHPVVQVPPEAVALLATAAPRFVRPPESVCCYVQPLRGTGDPRLVLGMVTAGYGRGLSRLHRALGSAGVPAPPAAHLRTRLAGVDTLECPGILGGGINLRTITADRTFRYPGTTYGAAPALSPTDLVAQYDPDRGRLVCRDRTGRQVRPLHLGMVAQYWQPPGLQYLVRVFGEPAVAMVPGWILRSGPTLPAAGRVEQWPRVDVGRVTLVRRCVRLRAGDFPTPAATEQEAHYLCRLAAWLAEHGIRRRFFARVIDLRAGLSGVLGKRGKPLYVDVTDHLSLTGFLRSLRDPEALLVIEEALPDPADAPAYGRHGPRVTEYVIQLSARQAQP